jgi:hypothetical protein
MEFSTTVELHGKTATGMAVPPAVVEALGGGRKPAVTVTVGSYSYRTTIGSMGGRFLIPLSAENRVAAGVAAGDAVVLVVELDTAPREVEVPAELATALAAEPGLRERFDALAPSYRKEHARAVTSAKAPATRERRIAAVVAALRAG